MSSGGSLHESRVKFLLKFPDRETFCRIKAPLVVPCENVLFSLQNLRARSNKDAKDQTTKNSLESKFSVLRPLRAPVRVTLQAGDTHAGKANAPPAGSPSGTFAAPDFQ